MPDPEGKIAEMTEPTNSRIAWYNGKFVPESQVLIPFRDRGWRYGDGAFDMTRTFNGRAFRLEEHIDRFYRSLRYLRLDPRLTPREMIDISEQIVACNEHLRAAAGDWWIGQRVSRGVKEVPGDNLDYHGPNVVIECVPLPFRQRARLFIEGIKVMVPSHRRTPPESLTPRAKTHNYLNLIVANQEIHAIDPSAWAILLDTNGNLCEGLGSNIFIVKSGEIFTPREKYVLPGVSRQTAIDLARDAGITVTEADLDLYDAYNADEVFITSTSLCLCPVVSVNGVHVGPEGQVWGPMTKKLVDAYIRFVDFDFVAQYMKFFDDKVSSTPF